MKPRYLLASWSLVVFAWLGVLLAQENPGRPGDKANQIKEDLTIREQILARQYAEFQDSLLKLKQRLERSPKAEDRERAKVLERALEQAKDASISTQFEQMVDFLKNQKLSEIGDIKKAVDRSSKLAEDLRIVMALLREDLRSSKLRDEENRIKALLKEIQRIIHEQRMVQGQTDLGKTERVELKGLQGKITKDTAKLADKMGKDGQGGEAKNTKGEAKDGGKSGGKGGEGKDGGKGGEGKSGQSKDSGKGGEGKQGEGKSGKAGEGKDGEGKQGEAKGGQGGEGKQGGAKEGKGGEGKQGEAKGSKGGEPKEGSAKSGGKGGEGKQGEAKAGEKSSSGGKSGGEPKEGSAKSGGKGGGEPKEGGAKSGGKGGDGQKADSKSGGEGGDSKKSDSKSGSSSSGQGSAKGGGDQGQQGGSKDDGGKQPPSPPSNPQDNPATGKKQVEDANQYQKKSEDNIAQGKNKEASKEQEDAINKLEQARKKLEELLRQIREEELERLLANLINRCERMLALQIAVYHGTEQVYKSIEAQKDKKPTRDDQQRSLKLSDDEKEIVVEATKALEVLEAEGSAVAFPVVFEQVREDMKNVQRRLGIVDTGVVTQAIEKDIIDTLKEMIEALKKAKQELENGKTPPGQPPPPTANQDKKLLDQIAELKMIRSMQIRVNSRTKIYSREYNGEQAETPNIRRELNNLAERQERIFDITNKIAKGDNK